MKVDRQTHSRINAGRRAKAGKTTAKDRPTYSPCIGKRPHWSKLYFDVGREVCAYGERAILMGQDVEPFQEYCMENGYGDIAQGITFFHFEPNVDKRREIRRHYWNLNKGSMKKAFKVFIDWKNDRPTDLWEFEGATL